MFPSPKGNMSSMVPSTAKGVLNSCSQRDKGRNPMSPDMPLEQYIYTPEEENMDFIIKNLQQRGTWILGEHQIHFEGNMDYFIKNLYKRRTGIIRGNMDPCSPKGTWISRGEYDLCFPCLDQSEVRILHRSIRVWCSTSPTRTP